MPGKIPIEGPKGAGIASGRAVLYGLFVAVFGTIPDQDLIARIRHGEFQTMLGRCCELGDEGFRAGLERVASYQAKIADRSDEDVLTDIRVDQTRILRGTGHPELRPPHEGLYKGKRGIGDSLLEVRRFYRRAGLLPGETVHEAADYLGVELDFMRQLCLREQKEWLRGEPVVETIRTEAAFLREHLGNWVGEFCSMLERHAMTDFYKGIGLVLHAFLQTDQEWLERLTNQGGSERT